MVTLRLAAGIVAALAFASPAAVETVSGKLAAGTAKLPKSARAGQAIAVRPPGGCALDGTGHRRVTASVRPAAGRAAADMDDPGTEDGGRRPRSDQPRPV
jgi:hypothetical protein